MEDVVSDDIERMSKAQTQASNIAFKYKVISMMQGQRIIYNVFWGSNGKKNYYLSLEGKNAVGTVRIDPETNQPITVFDEEMGI